MTLTKVQADGVNLADTFAFTGTVSGAGSKILIKSITISSATASVEFKNGVSDVVFDSTYTRYELTVDEVIPATNDVDLEFLLSTNAGSSYSGDSAYNQVIWAAQSNGSTTADTPSYVNDHAVKSGIGQGNTTNRGGTMGTVLFSKPSTAKYVQIRGDFWGWTHNGYLTVSSACGQVENVQDIDAVKIAFSSGNIASGVFKLYGIL
tara:strand:+ start:52 stop:669 length:618 start_codon:yes stop_codon:yes gene_type:complete